MKPLCLSIIPLLVVAHSKGGPERAGVVARTIEHYAPGRYQGPLWPVPSHTDGNPRHAVVIDWPIGWLNSQAADWKPSSPFLYSFGSIGHFLIPTGRHIRSFWTDCSALYADMDFNHWTERREFCVLLERATSREIIECVGRAWLNQGEACGRPKSMEHLRDTP